MGRINLRKMKARSSENSEAGFTLIELLIAILIIGILAAIAVPMFLNQREQAQIAALKSDMRTAATAMHTFYTSHGLREALPQQDESGNNIHSGWSIIVWGSDDARFTGQSRVGLEPNIYPEGMDPFPISEGIALGVVASVSGGRELGEFCILGNAMGTRYESMIPGERPPGVSAFSKPMYYDSANGGLFDPEDLPEEGACGSYAIRIKNGN